MEKQIFEKFRDLIYNTSGITLSEQKEALVSSRISKRMRTLKIDKHQDYYKYIISDTTGNEIIHLLDAISTNVTNFFRESHHFDFLTDIVTEWNKNGQRRFRFWSAGCSTGEEPYTLAISLLESGIGRITDTKILATDISMQVLKHCIKGEYGSKKMKDVSPVHTERYFDKKGVNESAQYTAKPELKSMITFKRLNLSVVPFPMKGPMDIIFCRNVVIYFDNIVRRNLLNEFYRLLKPGGYLMVGHAETLAGLKCSFKSVKPSIYTKV